MEARQSAVIVKQDSLPSKVFVDETDFVLFLYDEFNLYQNDQLINQGSSSEKDSLFQVLNQQKSIKILRSQLPYFVEYNRIDPKVQVLTSQLVDLMPRSINSSYVFDVNEGDQLRITFSILKFFKKSSAIDLSFNQVLLKNSRSISRKKQFTYDFIAQESGKLELVLKNFRFFRAQGFLEVTRVPRKENIKVQAFHVAKSHFEVKDLEVIDTLYQTIVEEKLSLSHQLNIQKNFMVKLPLKIEMEKEILGFGVFLYPTSESENLLVHRKDVYREDPMEDFAKKELLKNSFTYLKEFAWKDIDMMVFDGANQSVWKNGAMLSSEGFSVGANGKGNYAFFKMNGRNSQFDNFVKVSNKSHLYDYDLSLKVILVYLEKFLIKGEIEVIEKEEFIILTLF